MTTQIIVTVPFRGLHCWPDATPHRHYLGDPHLHTFKVRVWVPVQHDDRDVEFHDMQLILRDYIHNLFPEAGGFLQMAGTSCEQLAKLVMETFPDLTKVQIWEDEDNGAEVVR